MNTANKRNVKQKGVEFFGKLFLAPPSDEDVARLRVYLSAGLDFFARNLNNPFESGTITVGALCTFMTDAPLHRSRFGGLK